MRLLGANTFRGGDVFSIGDIRIRPLVIDHSATDSYMFVIEAEGKTCLIQVISGGMGCAITY